MILNQFVLFIIYQIISCGNLENTITLLKNDDKLNFICYLFYYILYFSDEYPDIWSWDNTNVFKSNGNNMIPAISLLAGHSIHIKNMKERNYDSYQIEKHKQNINDVIMKDYLLIKGIRFRHMIWLSHFIKCDIIEIGILQYNYKPSVDAPFLDNSKYHIELHIPGKNGLNIDEVKQSLKDAKKYIYSYFNLNPNKELQCYVQSWLFSPELKYFLNENSNILKFQKLFNIVKYEENLKDFMLFVFNLFHVPKDFTVLKAETSLQKNLKDYLLKGNKLHIGTAILKNF